MSKQRFSVGIMAAALAAMGCSEPATAPGVGEPELGRADAVHLAEEFDAMTHVALGGWLDPHVAPVRAGSHGHAGEWGVTESFTRTRACPAGGQVTVSGTVKREGDRATRTLTTEIDATKTQSACTIGKRDGVVVTVSGDPNIAIKASRKIVNGAPSGPQTTTHKGAFTYQTSTGKSGSCTVDLTSTFDPEAKTHTRKGTLCGRTVDVTRTVRRP